MSYHDPIDHPQVGDVYSGYFQCPFRDAFKPRQESYGYSRSCWRVVAVGTDPRNCQPTLTYEAIDRHGKVEHPGVTDTLSLINFMSILIGADARTLVENKENNNE